MYRRYNYLSNKESFLIKQRKYRKQNRDKILKKRKEYENRIEVKLRINLLKKQWKKKNQEKFLKQKKKDDKIYYEKNKNNPNFILKRTSKSKEYYQKNKERIALRQKIHSQKPEVKARRNLMARLRRRANPQSNRSDPLELQFAKNRVRIRDGNRCKWQGCNITHKEDKIHVHHIFPRSEHPELELVEQYMICYCSTHHRQFHRMRGDHYSEMIKSDSSHDLELNSVRGRD